MIVSSGRGRWMPGWIGTAAGGTDKLDDAVPGGNVHPGATTRVDLCIQISKDEKMSNKNIH